MWRHVMSAIVTVTLANSYAAPTRGDEFVLKLECVAPEQATGRDQAAGAERPIREQVLYSVEVVTQPDCVFRTRTHVGGKILSFAGILRPIANGQFLVEFEHSHANRREVAITPRAGRAAPVVTAPAVAQVAPAGNSSLTSTVLIRPGASTVVGGVEATNAQATNVEATRTNTAGFQATRATRNADVQLRLTLLPFTTNP